MSTTADEGANTIDVVSTAADAQLTAVTETPSTDPVAVISSTSSKTKIYAHLSQGSLIRVFAKAVHII